MSEGAGWMVLAAVGLLVGVGGIAFGADQQSEREKEQKNSRAQIQALKAQLSAKETQLAVLRTRFGEKNAQVRDLADEVNRLRHEIDGPEENAGRNWTLAM